MTPSPRRARTPGPITPRPSSSPPTAPPSRYLIRRARAHVRSKLAAWNIDEDTAQATELVISELVTNAIRYGTPPMWLRIIKDLSISVEIHDGSPVAPRLRHPGTLDEFGRGLGI